MERVVARSKMAVLREPVTRERAVRVAVALADAGGIDSLSMRKLAGELGIEAMSLYYHVRNKDDLLDAMVEAVVSQIALPSKGAHWKTALRERADSERTVLGQHPWAISLIDSRTTPATLKHHDAMIGCLTAAGFTMPMVGHALSLVDSYVHGFALQEDALPLDESGDIGEATENIMAQQESMAEMFPHLAQMAVELVLQPGYKYGNEFEFGIQLILDGLEVRMASKPPHDA